jgi:aryl carrier-like protein
MLHWAALSRLLRANVATYSSSQEIFHLLWEEERTLGKTMNLVLNGLHSKRVVQTKERCVGDMCKA